MIRRLIGEAEGVFEVSQAQRNALAEDGIVRLEGLIDRELLAILQSCWEWSVRHPGPIASGKPEVVDVVADIAGIEPRAWSP